MSKYSLVASYYDRYEKNPNLKYKNEVEINLPNADLSTIQAIDYFTTSHSKIDIFRLIEKYQKITGKNHLAIKVKRGNEVDYFRVIYDNKSFIDCTKNNPSKTYQISGKYRTTLVVPDNADLFQTEKRKLLQILEERDFLEFQKIYSYQDDLEFLVRRYLNSFYDTENARLTELSLIILEFSRYMTFRKWIIDQEKQKQLQKETTSNHQKKNIKASPVCQQSKPIVPSKEEYEEEYEKKFIQLHNISYATYQMRQYNTSHLEEDKEEFLEEHEIEQIYIHPLTKSLHR